MTERNIVACLSVICAQLRLGRCDALADGVMSPDTERLFRAVLAEMTDDRGPMCVLDVCRSSKFSVRPGDLWEHYGHAAPAVVRAPEEFRIQHRVMMRELESRLALQAAVRPASRTHELVMRLAEGAATGRRQGGMRPALSPPAYDSEQSR